MIFRETPIPGLVIIEPTRHEDPRGHFVRTMATDEFESHGLRADFTQCSTSYNQKRGTLRGLHYQAPPYQEAKLVRCTRGRAFDIAVDLRAGSPTFGQWRAVELTADNGIQVYIPEGMAHGFQALEDGTELAYQITTPYCAEAARGVRWNDPELAIPWPLPKPTISARDQALPTFAALRLQGAIAC